jgi:hypothetical protein
MQPANRYKRTQLTPKAASVVPPEDGRLTPETCRGLRHNNVIVKVKVFEVSHVIVIIFNNYRKPSKYTNCYERTTARTVVMPGWKMTKQNYNLRRELLHSGLLRSEK